MKDKYDARSTALVTTVLNACSRLSAKTGHDDREKAAGATRDTTRTYLSEEADRNEREVLARLPALLAALGTGGS